MQKVLITGSKGLVGTRLCSALEARGIDVVHLDVAGSGHEYGDVTNYSDIASRITDVDGVIHLAAVSRVVWGEQDPEKCRFTNVNGTQNIVNAAIESKNKPWILFASSREVYGEIGDVPITEDAAFAPVSVYGNTKVEAEKIMISARSGGLTTGIVRLSNVYGSPRDHRDRVLPAFVTAALEGGELRVEGGENHYDFTHVDDTVDGIIRYIQLLDLGENVQPIHLLTGVSTSLASLADMVIAELGSRSSILNCTPRDYGSGKFFGDNSNARRLLGWQPKIGLREGIVKLAKAIQEARLRTTTSG